MSNKHFLFDHQRQAIDRMFNGCILNGGVGSGKSRTGLYYYFSKNGGSMEPKYKVGDMVLAKEVNAKDIEVLDVLHMSRKMMKSKKYYK